MAYEAGKDVCYGEWWLEDTNFSDLRLSVHSYDGKEPKVSITRFKVSRPDSEGKVHRKWAPLRRLDDYEWKWILDHAGKVREAIEKAEPVEQSTETERRAA